MITRKNTARIERNQLKIDAGSMNEHFPEVSGIVIKMTYSQRGIKSPLMRTIHYYPGSYAYFSIECLDKDCNKGGFDFTKVIKSMVRNRKQSAKGELKCEGDAIPANHSAIVYEVSIQYSK